MRDALNGITLLEVGTMTPGKFAGFLLTAWGAASVRVERPDAVGSISTEDLTLNRGKRSITLNLRAVEGREVLMRLAEKADVLIESYRPGVTSRLGIDADTMREINPRLIYCSLSGYGQTGPAGLRPAFDLNIQAETGFSSLMAGGGPPVYPGTFIADSTAGLMIAFAVATALRGRDAKGEGAHLDLSMQECLFSLLAVSHGTKPLDETWQTRPNQAAYDFFETANGRYVALGAARPASCKALFDHLGRADLAPAGLLRGEEGKPARTFLRKVFLQKSAADWIAELVPLDIEITGVNTMNEVFSDAQLQQRSMIVDAIHPVAGQLQQIGVPGLGAEVRDLTAAPEIGVDTDAILRELGYNEDGISKLRKNSAI